MPSAVRTLLLSAALTVGCVGIGVGVVGPAGDSSEPALDAPPVNGAQAGAEAAPPTLGDLETRGLAVVRAPFCAGVPDTAVEAALAGPAEEGVSWANGETAPLTPTTTDVAHEHGCRWTRGRTTASGWVFAPPVTEARAQELGRSAAGRRGCEPVADAPTLGTAGTALLCRRGRDGARAEVSYRGLLGDAWLVCSLTGRPAEDLLARADRWCGAVVTAATGATAPG